MIKIFLPCIFIIGLISCKPLTELVDYFGQTYPNSTPEVFAPEVVSIKGRFEHGISFTPDGDELAFGIINNDDSGTVHYSKKANGNWTAPMVFEPLKGKSAFLPYFTPDGKRLLYAQSKPGKDNLYVTDIWRIEKNKNHWSSPQIAPSPLSSISREANACMTLDGTIYFSSNRNCLGKENCFDADLFYSKLIDNEYQTAQEVHGFISSNDEESVFISPEEKYLLFCRYNDNETGMDLYISYRNSDNNWTEAQLLNSTINSKEWDRRPFVSIDNKFLFFTRLQIGEKGIIESDIYWVNTSNVFKPFVYNPLSDTTLQVGEKFELSIPLDYFKDIDDEQLTISINQSEFDWLDFDSEKMKLSGLPRLEGDFELTFTVVDGSSNVTEDKVRITVKR